MVLNDINAYDGNNDYEKNLKSWCKKNQIDSTARQMSVDNMRITFIQS